MRRVTSFLIGKVSHCKTRQKSLEAQILGKIFSNTAIERENQETVAKEQFLSYLSKQPVNEMLMLYSLMIDKENIFLAISQDGLVVCNCCEIALLEYSAYNISHIIPQLSMAPANLSKFLRLQKSPLNSKPSIRPKSPQRLLEVSQRHLVFMYGALNEIELLESINDNITFHRIPEELHVAYLRNHLTGSAPDWYDVIGADFRAVIRTLHYPPIEILHLKPTSSSKLHLTSRSHTPPLLRKITHPPLHSQTQKTPPYYFVIDSSFLPTSHPHPTNLRLPNAAVKSCF
ncbi:hypothetical protein NPIL_686621 [Nephila pilipes]|uniref:Uncharacterized protein n=1 Tax=Nephila pilipes TaxID=299642 RepID=A0A8X6K406_NEPPI|nr:hypothetical protein NPIL_686621 [Nephila pilipes]